MINRMNAKKIREIFLRFRKANPHPATELVYHNHFELLIAVILSAQATDKSVNKATPALFAIANTPAKMAALGERKLCHYIKTIGLYKSKARNIIAACNRLVNDFHSRVPHTREELESLSG